MVLPPLPDHLRPEPPKFSSPAVHPPAFGHALRPCFSLDFHKWLHMNNGSYGTAPLCVLDASKQWTDLSNALPDLFHKAMYQGPLNNIRARIAGLMHTERDNVVLVGNSTTAVNCVLRSVPWNKGDVILCYDTAYGSCSAAIKLLKDRYAVEVDVLSLAYPLEHDALLEQTKKRIQALKREGKVVRLMLLDALSSTPGVIVPWERVVALLKEEQVLSLVDGAHAIGQVPVDLTATQPDFFLSNMHKWLFAQRGAAFLYVDPKYQRMINPLPTSAAYVSDGSVFQPNDYFSTESGFVSQFEWLGTSNMSSLLSADVAMDFREWLGGEEAIMAYNHKLTKEGGRAVAKILATETLEAKESELVGAMINVRLPFPGVTSQEAVQQMMKEFGYKMMFEKSTWAVFFLHNGVPFVRLSGQVYLDMSDFEEMGRRLKELCDEVSHLAH